MTTRRKKSIRQLTGICLFGCLVAASMIQQALAQTDIPPNGPGEISVVLVGQALIKKDLRTLTPAAVEQARDYIGQADVAFTNLEVALAPGDSGQATGPGELIPPPPSVLDCLRDMGFNLLSLANNHAVDQGTEGIEYTRKAAASRGFALAGTGNNLAEAISPGELNTPAGKVALVAMASGAKQLTPDTWATPEHAGVNFLELEENGMLNAAQKNRILEAVRQAAQDSSLVIAYQHNHYWGESHDIAGPPGREPRVDRFSTPAWMESWARELIDAGASIYVAHGNPALHGIEIYKEKLILYGLGNYIFHSTGTLDKFGPLAYYSAAIDARFVSGRVKSIQIRPLVLALDPPARGAPFLATGGEALAILGRLKDLSQAYGTEIQIHGDLAEIVLK